MNTPEGYWTDGFRAAERGLPVDACPLLFDAWPADAWRQGHAFYIWASQVPYQSRTEPLQVVDKPAELQGAIAHSEGRALDTCPYGINSQDGRKWRLGWIEAFNQGRAEYQAETTRQGNFALGCLIGLFFTVVIAGLCVGIALAIRQHMLPNWLAWITTIG